MQERGLLLLLLLLLLLKHLCLSAALSRDSSHPSCDVIFAHSASEVRAIIIIISSGNFWIFAGSGPETENIIGVAL